MPIRIALFVHTCPVLMPYHTRSDIENVCTHYCILTVRTYVLRQCTVNFSRMQGRRKGGSQVGHGHPTLWPASAIFIASKCKHLLMTITDVHDTIYNTH